MIRSINQPLKIIDDFLEAPFIWREFALKQEYSKDESGHPGKKSKSLDEIDINIFHSLAGNIIKHVNGKKNFQRLKINFTSCVKEDQLKNTVPHQDEPFYNVAGVLYLNLNPPVDSGTIFYNIKNNIPVRTVTVENVFNRLILFNPNIWHSPANLFGEDLNSSRLTMTIFGIAL